MRTIITGMADVTKPQRLLITPVYVATSDVPLVPMLFPITKNYGIACIGLPRLQDRSVASFARANGIELIEWLHPHLMLMPDTVELFQPTVVFGVNENDDLLRQALDADIPAFILDVEAGRMTGA